MNLSQKNKGFASLQMILIITICLSIIAFLFSEVENKRKYVSVRVGGLQEQLYSESIFVVVEDILIKKLETLYNNPPLNRVFRGNDLNVSDSNMEINRYAFSRLTQYGYQDLRTSIRSSKVIEDFGYRNLELKLTTYLVDNKTGVKVFKRITTENLDKEMVNYNFRESKDFALNLEITTKKEDLTYFYRKTYFFNLPEFTKEELIPGKEAYESGQTNYVFDKVIDPKVHLIPMEAQYEKR